MVDFSGIPVERRGSGSLKYDGASAKFGAEVSPFWVADMDFAAPRAVTEALMKRASHPVYGYTLYPDEFYRSLADWLAKRHGWEVKREWIAPAPGVVPSLHAAVRAFTRKGEGVIVQTPVYFPFISAVEENGRRLIENPLLLANGHYEIDFSHLEECASRAKLLLFCSPHNPVGRVWRQEELIEVAKIAKKHDLVVLADEIHSDLILAGSRHHPLAAFYDKVITAVSPSKTFNIPGLGQSALVAKDQELLRAASGFFSSLGLNANPFSIAAFCAAYREGEGWLGDLLSCLAGNLEFALEFFASNIPEISALRPEGTYLLWLDCRGLSLPDPELQRLFVEQAKVGLSPGTNFGDKGSGFMRLNFATAKEALAAALRSIQAALSNR